MNARPDVEAMKRDALLAYIYDLEAKLDMVVDATTPDDTGTLQAVFGLTRQEAKLLAALKDGRLLRKMQIVNLLYFDRPNDVPEPKIVDVFVCKLRKKLASTGIGIETVWGAGHRLLGGDRLNAILAAGPNAVVERVDEDPGYVGHKPRGATAAEGHGAVRDRALDALNARADVKGLVSITSAELTYGARLVGVSGSSMIRALETAGHLKVLKRASRVGPWRLKMRDVA